MKLYSHTMCMCVSSARAEPFCQRFGELGFVLLGGTLRPSVRIPDSGLAVLGLGFEVVGLGFEVWGLRFAVWGFWFRV